MVRFLADADLRHAIVTGCLRREPAIEFLSANAARLEGLGDFEVLAVAAEQDRILVTHDFRTMPRHFAVFLEARGTCPGVFLVKQRAPLANIIEALILVWAASDPGEWRDRCVEMPLP
jgi:predicted nuclease of predicted toxin-antitoxin system